jgi:two-component system, NarL family, response regulator NreC
VSESLVRVVLADDHAVVREGLRLLLERTARFEVVAEAGDAESALRYARGHKPDVLLLDLAMPGGDSLGVMPEILAASQETKVIVLTMQTAPSYARAAFEAGAAGFVVKDAAHRELLQAIDAALAGSRYVHPAIGAALVADDRRPDRLTDRELDVLRLLVEGDTNAEVAVKLGISVRTVDTHRARIRAKTSCVGRSDLVRYARAHGLAS